MSGHQSKKIAKVHSTATRRPKRRRQSPAVDFNYKQIRHCLVTILQNSQTFLVLTVQVRRRGGGSTIVHVPISARLLLV